MNDALSPAALQRYLQVFQCHPTKPPLPYTVALISHATISAAAQSFRRLLECQALGATAVLGWPISHLVAFTVTHEAGDLWETSSNGRRRRGGLDLQQSPACRNLPVTCKPHKPSASRPRPRSSQASQSPALSGYLWARSRTPAACPSARGEATKNSCGTQNSRTFCPFEENEKGKSPQT